MSPIRIVILLVAALAAAGAAFLVRGMAQAPEAASPQQVAPVQQVIEQIEVPQTPVLVMVRDVSVGELMTPADFVWRDWPDETLNVNYYTQDIFPEAPVDLAASVVRTAMVENEPVLPHKLVTKGQTGYMAALLTPGMRAVSVEISTDNASGGFILPGDRVDVMIAYAVEVEVEGEMVTQPTVTTILENVRILAIDQLFGENAGGQFAIGSTATVELEPDQARLLVVAEQLGTVSLALRALQDAEDGGPTLARTDFLIDVDPVQAGGGQGADPGTVRIYRQGQATTVTPAEGS